MQQVQVGSQWLQVSSASSNRTLRSRRGGGRAGGVSGEGECGVRGTGVREAGSSTKEAEATGKEIEARRGSGSTHAAALRTAQGGAELSWLARRAPQRPQHAAAAQEERLAPPPHQVRHDKLVQRAGQCLPGGSSSGRVGAM